MTGKYAENSAEAAGLDIIARFAVMQENAQGALSSYLDKTLDEHVKRVLWRRIRLSDDERLQALVAVAQASGYPLHEQGFRDVFQGARKVRNLLAHGGTMLATREPNTDEPGLMTFTDEGQPIHYSLADLRSTASDSRWLASVAWRIRGLHSGEGVPRSVRVPSDLPLSTITGFPASMAHWPTPEVCPNGHGNIVGVETRYGNAWRCGHCGHLRLLDENVLSGPRSTLVKSETPTPPRIVDGGDDAGT